MGNLRLCERRKPRQMGISAAAAMARKARPRLRISRSVVQILRGAPLRRQQPQGIAGAPPERAGGAFLGSPSRLPSNAPWTPLEAGGNGPPSPASRGWRCAYGALCPLCPDVGGRVPSPRDDGKAPSCLANHSSACRAASWVASTKRGGGSACSCTLDSSASRMGEASPRSPQG